MNLFGSYSVLPDTTKQHYWNPPVPPSRFGGCCPKNLRLTAMAACPVAEQHRSGSLLPGGLAMWCRAAWRRCQRSPQASHWEHGACNQARGSRAASSCQGTPDSLQSVCELRARSQNRTRAATRLKALCNTGLRAAPQITAMANLRRVAAMLHRVSRASCQSRHVCTFGVDRRTLPVPELSLQSKRVLGRCADSATAW